MTKQMTAEFVQANPLDSLVVRAFADTVDWDEDAVEVACDAVLTELGF